MKLTGFDELAEALDNIKNSCDEIVRDEMFNLCEEVKEKAQANVSVKSGELMESITSDVKVEGDIIHGEVSTDKQYAQYIEFGTGPKGQAEHEGISPEVGAITYRSTGWVIPAEAMSAEDAELYHYTAIKNPDGSIRGYYTKGQAAKPFLYPAAKDVDMKKFKTDTVERMVKDARSKR